MVYHGVKKVYHGVRKVYHGVRKVNHGASPVHYIVVQQNTTVSLMYWTGLDWTLLAPWLTLVTPR